ncbi:hypothetical protein [Pseudomonas lurida]|uniref:hypothetical protein n=1 Tax=Pseudomonas lurida TaxID=244566 RepID=UPI0034D9551C
MWLDKDIALVVLYAGLIVLSPFAYKLSAAVARYLFYKYLAHEVVYVTYKDDGLIVAQFKVSRKSDDSVVQQLGRSKKGGSDHE